MKISTTSIIILRTLLSSVWLPYSPAAAYDINWYVHPICLLASIQPLSFVYFSLKPIRDALSFLSIYPEQMPDPITARYQFAELAFLLGASSGV